MSKHGPTGGRLYLSNYGQITQHDIFELSFHLVKQRHPSRSSASVTRFNRNTQILVLYNKYISVLLAAPYIAGILFF